MRLAGTRAVLEAKIRDFLEAEDKDKGLAWGMWLFVWYDLEERWVEEYGYNIALIEDLKPPQAEA